MCKVMEQADGPPDDYATSAYSNNITSKGWMSSLFYSRDGADIQVMPRESTQVGISSLTNQPFLHLFAFLKPDGVRRRIA